MEDYQGADSEDLQEDVEEEEDWKAPALMGQDHGVTGTSSVREKDDVGYSDHRRTIVHIDLDCFYAQVEMIRDPSLRNKPLGIQQKNIVVTTNYVARERNVGKLAYIKDALEKCPDLVLVSGEDLTHYREMSYKVTEVLQRFDPAVERLGFDENYIDVSSLVERRLQNNITQDETDGINVAGHLYNSEPIPECICGCHQRLVIGSLIAKEMRETLYKELQLTSCAGVAHNKLLAKLVGGHHKPNNQTTIYPEHARQMVRSLGKVRAIPGIGHTTAKRLASMGISTIQELLDASKTALESEFGQQQASTMQQLAQGVDNSQVTATGAPQSISDEDSFKKCSTLSNAKERMLGLLQNLLKRLKSDGRVPQTIRVTVRKYAPKQWKRESRQCSIPSGIFKAPNKEESATLSKLLDICIGLFHKMVDSSKPFHLTLINICFAKMQTSGKTSANINNFFSPKTSVKKSATLQKTSATEASACTITDNVGEQDAITWTYTDDSHLRKDISGKSNDFMKHQTLAAAESPTRTLDAFFSSPKRKRARLSQSDNSDTLLTQFQTETSLDRFESKRTSPSSNFQDTRTLNMQSASTVMKSQQSKILNMSSTQTDGREFPKVHVRTANDDGDIPPNVDPDVFRELPADVQEELKTQYRADLHAHDAYSESESTHSIGSSSTETKCSSDISDTKNKSTENLFQTAGRMQICDKNSCKDNVMVKEASQSQHVTDSLPTQTPSSSEAVSNSSSSSCSKTPTTAAVADVNVPPGIDPIVFAGLPSEMQQELVKEWKQGRYEISSVDLGHSGRKHSHGRTKAKGRGKNISDYFKK